MITEATIRQYSEPESYRRGEQYYRQGAVRSLVRRGDSIHAEVEGSGYSAYRVEVSLEGDGEIEAECSCPYEYGGWCKHIVAALLACRNEPDAVEERLDLETLLKDLSVDELRAILGKLTERHSNLLSEIETQIQGLRRMTAKTPASETTGFPAIDSRPIRRQVREALRRLERSYDYDYEYVGGVIDAIRNLLQDAQNCIEAGDGRGALTILEAITEEYLPAFEYLDDSDGDVSGLYDELDPLWTEAILTADFSQTERLAWGKKLTKWQRTIEDYGVDAFYAAITAAEQGWDDPHLLAVLQGTRTEPKPETDPEEEMWTNDELVQARLNVLERQGRIQEALRLAYAERQTERYTALLLKLGQVAEAVEYGLRHFTRSEEALAMAQLLHGRQVLPEAMRIGEQGLRLSGPKAHLGRWLRDFALAQGKTGLALQAATFAIREAPGLDDYKLLQELAGENWPALYTELLPLLRSISYPTSGLIDIFLYEGLVDEALAAVRKGGDYALLRRVAEAAVSTHPEEVISICTEQAESIMDRGKADLYHYAAEWLAIARAAYFVAGQFEQWQRYLAQILTQHQRKYKLVPLLKNLDVSRP